MLSPPTRQEPRQERAPRRSARGGRRDRVFGAPEGRPHLAEHFARCFVFALQLRDAAHAGDPGTLRRRAVDLIEQAARAARRDGAPVEDVREAEFAVVALIDEAVMTSDWIGKEQWKAAPLQLERYDRFDAGETFFERLEALRDRPDAAGVVEVFFLCLALGFKGRYQFLPPEELRRLVEDVQDDLLRHHREGAPLAPHGLSRYAAPAAAARARATWPLVVAALVLAVVLYVLGRLVVGGEAADAVRTVERVDPRVEAPRTPVMPTPPPAPVPETQPTPQP